MKKATKKNRQKIKIAAKAMPTLAPVEIAGVSDELFCEALVDDGEATANVEVEEREEVREAEEVEGGVEETSGAMVEGGGSEEVSEELVDVGGSEEEVGVCSRRWLDTWAFLWESHGVAYVCIWSKDSRAADSTDYRCVCSYSDSVDSSHRDNKSRLCSRASRGTNDGGFIPIRVSCGHSEDLIGIGR